MSARSPDAPGLLAALDEFAPSVAPDYPRYARWLRAKEDIRAALAASGVAPSPTEAIERLARLLVDESAYGNLEAAKAAIARAGVAPSPDVPGLRAAMERIAKGHDWQPGQPTHGWASCQQIADAALAATPDAPGLLAALEDEGVVTWADDGHRARFIASLAAEWESDETIVNQMEATEYASESHPTKERTDG